MARFRPKRRVDAHLPWTLRAEAGQDSVRPAAGPRTAKQKPAVQSQEQEASSGEYRPIAAPHQGTLNVRNGSVAAGPLRVVSRSRAAVAQLESAPCNTGSMCGSSPTRCPPANECPQWVESGRSAMGGKPMSELVRADRPAANQRSSSLLAWLPPGRPDLTFPGEGLAPATARCCPGAASSPAGRCLRSPGASFAAYRC